MKMTMTATGDTILIQGFPEEGYPGLKQLQDYIGKGQARFGNLETCITEWDTAPAYFSGGTWMNGEPRVLDQILAYGMNFLGFANNHTMDLGPDGMRETLANIKKRGVACAGAGEDLAKASQPVYRDFPGGRVAFIAVTSGGANMAAAAGYASKTMRGRPGSNALRSSAKIMVNQEHFNVIREIREATQFSAASDLSRKNGFRPPLPEGVIDLGTLNFCLTDGKEERVTSCHKRDLARILDAIKDAQYIADYVVVMYHGHEIKGAEITVPADFHFEFAHACIDAGACAFFGGGTHQFKPMEIYNGKPIFYSLGNFCFQSNMVEHQPSDMLDKYGLSNISDVQALAARNKDWTIGQHTQPENFLTAIPYLEFEDGKLTHLELKPVDLGFDKPRTQKGLPYPSEGAVAKEIFETLQALSQPYGVKMSQREDGIIDVCLN